VHARESHRTAQVFAFVKGTLTQPNTAGPTTQHRMTRSTAQSPSRHAHARITTADPTTQVVAFVKGTRTQPACGFSHKMMTILNENKADYEVVNVLDEVWEWGEVWGVGDTPRRSAARGCEARSRLTPSGPKPQTLKPQTPTLHAHTQIANPGLRDAIKTFSQWPTIPQLYVGGEFLGGADIVDQMNASGELATVLKE
jgi:glutaredoxin-related protein